MFHLLSRSSLRLAGGVATSAAVVGGGALILASNQTSQQSRSQNEGFSFLREPQAFSSTSLIVPTLQASGRVLRLLKTAVLIAFDYKTADLSSRRLQGGYDPNAPGKDDNREMWELEVEKRRKDLKDAQNVYSNESHPQLAPHERLALKRQEKEAMHAAAKELAIAEEKLSLLGQSNKSQLHRKAAKRILQLCHDNKGVYIKVGQHLANLDYLIPQEYIEELSALFDNNPRTNVESVRQVIREDLGQDPDVLFDSFDPEPIASASLAQVHVAYEKGTQRKLAVKVQHVGLRETSAGDLFALVCVVRVAEYLFDGFTWGWLADEIAPQLPKELDFANEGRNAERAAANIAKVGGLNCIVPKILWQYSSPRVMTMEFEEGFRATDVDAMERAGLNKRDVARLISSVFSSQVFLSGWVHCDPHPANVLLRAKNGKPQMVLVDHGLYRELDPDFRKRYAFLWKSLMLADLEGIKSACSSLGVEKAYALFAAMLTARPFDEMIERSKTKSLHHVGDAGSRADQAVIRNYAQRYLHDIFNLLGQVPRQMLLLLKMNDCLRHIDYSLGSPANTLVVCGRYAARSFYEDVMNDQRSSLLDRLRAWWSYARVITRIYVHDVAVWWLTTRQPSYSRLSLP